MLVTNQAQGAGVSMRTLLLHSPYFPSQPRWFIHPGDREDENWEE